MPDEPDEFVTLYAGPLDGLTIPRTQLESLVQDHGTERFLFLTHRGASSLYQETGNRWTYATPHLLNEEEEEAP